MSKGRKSSRPGLTVAQLGELAEKSLKNSVDLLGDAEGLFDAGSYPRAFALGVLAAEEFGKHMMCLGALGREEDDTEFWSDFWDRFTWHRPKYSNAAEFLGIHLADPDARRRFMAAIKEHVQSDQAKKMAGFYVDVDGSGAVVAPSEAVAAESAKGLLGVLAISVRSYDEHFGAMDWTAQFEEDWSAAAEMQAALKAKDRELLQLLFLKRGGIDLDKEPDAGDE